VDRPGAALGGLTPGLARARHASVAHRSRHRDAQEGALLVRCSWPHDVEPARLPGRPAARVAIAVFGADVQIGDLDADHAPHHEADSRVREAVRGGLAPTLSALTYAEVTVGPARLGRDGERAPDCWRRKAGRARDVRRPTPARRRADRRPRAGRLTRRPSRSNVEDQRSGRRRGVGRCTCDPVPARTPVFAARPDARVECVPTTVAEMLRELAADGWEIVARRGSHRQLRHPAKPGKVTVAGKRSAELHPRTETSIRRQAGLPMRSRR